MMIIKTVIFWVVILCSFCWWIPIFWRNILPSSSGLKCAGSETLDYISKYQGVHSTHGEGIEKGTLSEPMGMSIKRYKRGILHYHHKWKMD
jgi:hypothetical protein